MPDCPKCHTALVRRKNDFGVFWYCEQCEGSAITMSLLRKIVAKEALNGLWQRVRLGSYPRKHPCPGCRRLMEQITIDSEGKTRAVDVCSSCQFVWLDEGEWADLAFYAVESQSEVDLASRVRVQIEAKRTARQAPPQERGRPVAEPYLQAPQGAIIAAGAQERDQPRELREQPRSARIKSRTRKSRPETRSPERAKPRRNFERKKPRIEAKAPQASSGWGRGPSAFWHWIPALLGLPVEDEQPDGRRRSEEKPWCTWILAMGITLVSLLAFFDLRAMVDSYGLIPSQWERLGGLTWLTSFFLHGGLLHLVGNVYFLVIFGDNVEKCLGTLEFFMLLVLATLCGDFVHIWLDPNSTVPCIGASGGISGVIAFYALRFPKHQLAMVFWFFFKTYWWRMSAVWMFGIWVIFQCVIAGQQLVGISDVSGAAHLGGALVGVVAWLLWRINGGAQDEKPRFEGAYLR
ncbi:rhomboid family intramembrane serine protease [Coraliomargarita sp. W4R72]